MPPNRTVAVELRAIVASYIASMQQADRSTRQTAQQVLALSKAESDFRASIDQASAAVKANGQTLDRSTAQGRANQAALDQIASSSRQYRATLVAQGASQEQINAATLEGRQAWLSTASAMGMGEQQAKRLSSTLFSATKVLEDHRAELSAVGTTLGVVGAGLLLVAGKATKEYADFDKQMSAVAATGDDARASLDGLRQTAIEAGAATQFSATEAAEGVTNLLKAGVKAQDVIGGGLTGALNLAAAGQMSVADASEVAANTLNQFGLKGRDVSHVADLLVAGANAASGEVSDMAAALNNVGSVAHSSGLSLEETVGFLTEMAYAGHTGAEAGTQFKSMLMQLQAPSEKQQQALHDLNLSLYDNAGNTKKLTQFVDEYRASLEGKTQAEKDSYNAIVFGSYGIQAANVAYQQAGGSLQQWIDLINNQGVAQRQAAQLTDNLAGDIERLGGSLDTVFIQSGGGANNVLRQMAQSANTLVDGIGQIPGPLLSIATIMTGSGGLATVGVAGVLKLASAAADARANFKALGVSANTAKLAVGGVGAAVAIGTIALMAWADAQAQAKANADDFASTLVVVDGQVTTTSATLTEMVDKLTETKSLFGWGPSLMDLMEQVGISSQDAEGYLLGEADAVDRVNQAMQDYVRSNPLMGSTPTTMLKDGLDSLRGSLSDAERVTLQKAMADKDAGGAATSYTDAVTKSTAATEDNTSATDSNKDALDDWIKKQWAAADAALALSGSQVGFERMLDDTAAATKKLVKETKNKTDLTRIDTKAGQDAKDILDKIAAGTIARTKAMEKAQEPQQKITAEVERGRKALVDQARQMHFSEGAIADLVAKYDLLPENVTTTVDEQGVSDTQTRINNLFTSMKKLPKKQQAEIESTFNSKGIDAAEAALNKIGKKTVHPKIDPTLTKDNLKVHITASGTVSMGSVKFTKADGGILGRGLAGIVEQFASGGFGQPQIRPFQGAAGVQWGEQGSGPWEAFISGAPQKKDRSIAIWREVGQRLLGRFSAADVVQGFADGGITEPTWNGQTLSYWQDQLKTPLELTRLQISIRDLKKELAEQETYYTGKGKHKKKHRRLKLRGLDRTEAQQELAEDENELTLALQAQQLDKSSSGTIDAQLAAYQAAKDAADAATEAANTAAQNAQRLMQPYMTGSSALDLLANMQAGAQQVSSFNDLMGQLGAAGLSEQMMSWLWDQGTGAASIAQQILSGGLVDSFNAISGNLSKASDAAGQSQATGARVPSPVLTNTNLPSYVTSGSAGTAGSVTVTKAPVFNVQSDDPYGAAVIINQQLRYL